MCRRRRRCRSKSLDVGRPRTSSKFEPLFKQCHADLRSGVRKLLPFKNPSEIEVGKLFVLNGVLLYVAEMGERELDKIRKANAGLGASLRTVRSLIYSCSHLRATSTRTGAA